MGIHDRFIRDERFRKSMIELGRTEEVCREMDKLANEDHTHTTLLQKKLVCTATIGGSVPVRHRADFKEALSTLRRL